MSDQRVMLLGLVQSLFEGGTFTFGERGFAVRACVRVCLFSPISILLSRENDFLFCGRSAGVIFVIGERGVIYGGAYVVSNQDPPWTQKPIYTPIFTHQIKS